MILSGRFKYVKIVTICQKTSNKALKSMWKAKNRGFGIDIVQRKLSKKKTIMR